ncbi:hypothetical protein GCM10025868_35610 [Angustibacter aerolatus]|uniref:Alpha-D-phosphohexomutase alpha/beta/alpha domain-containing protein n=1 Tax=Angustibacter aerolatus TaxID=1162965 RepID=A0ABQ6JNR3_9ACTN|nr:hypothetical protein GCM10025868_35610 [Angustibacter aerolatus]
MDAALDAARERGADVVLANDPDADRCAVAVPDPQADGGWRVLRGDEVGVLLGAHVVERGVGPHDVLACSIVSSRWLAAVAAAHGVRHVETLTGFKWIARVPGLRYGYEEALGYCVDPGRVRDKDGVSAALLVAEARRDAEGAGPHAARPPRRAWPRRTACTPPTSTRCASPTSRSSRARCSGCGPPRRPSLGGSAVERTDDLTRGDGDLPPTDGLRYHLADGSRVIVRPSGTEPKRSATSRSSSRSTTICSTPGALRHSDSRH